MTNNRNGAGSRQDIISRLLFTPTFFTRNDLIKYVENLITFLDNEDSHLEKTGFPSRQFEHWYSPLASWQNLYFTKIPYDSIPSGITAKDWIESIQKRDPSITRKLKEESKQGKDNAFIWLKRPPSPFSSAPERLPASSSKLHKVEIPFAKLDFRFANFGYWTTNGEDLFDSSGKEACAVSFAEAKHFSWLSGRGNQVELIRPTLLQAKIRILVYTAEYLKSGGVAKSARVNDAFLENIANVLVEDIGSEALGFCSKVEELYAANQIFNCGGITSILRTVCQLSGSLKTYSEIGKKLSEFRESNEGDYPTYVYAQISDALLTEINIEYIRAKQNQIAVSFLTAEKIERIIDRSRKIKVVKTSKENKPLIAKHRTFQWAKVRISIADVGILSVEYRDVKYEISYEQLGLVDKKTGKSNRAWDVLIRMLAKSGVLNTDEPERSLRQQIMKIRASLKKIFGTNSDPFESNVKFKGAYVAKFNVGNISNAFIQQLKSNINQDQERSSWDPRHTDEYSHE